MPTPPDDDLGTCYLAVFPLVCLGDVGRNRRQVMFNSFFGFSHLGPPGPSHRTQLQLTNQHVMSSGGSWRRIQMLMITAKLRSAGRGSSRVGRHQRCWLDLFCFLTVLPRIVCIGLTLYLPGNPPGARATDGGNGGAAGHSEKGAEGSPAAAGGAEAEAAGAEAGAGRAAEICCPQRLREGEARGSFFPSNTSLEV